MLKNKKALVMSVLCAVASVGFVMSASAAEQTMQGNLDEIVIEDKGVFKNVFVALSNDKFHLKDADIILNMNLWEDKDD